MKQENWSVENFLNQHHIPFQKITHPALFTVEDAKQWEDTIPGSHTKNIFIKIKKWPYAMITIKAEKKLDTKIFKLQTGVKDFSFASPEDLMNQLWVSPWSVGIFWLINNPHIPLYIDQDIRSSEMAWRHPNDNTSTVVLTKKWLSDYLDIVKTTYKVIIL